MNSKYAVVCLFASLFTFAATGCVCGPCGGVGAGSSCDVGPYGAGAWDSGRQPIRSMIANASCSSGCGEVYVDEWLNEPPTVDNCGFDCGGCGRCGQCQPLRSALRLLWGTPYRGGCAAGGCDTVPNFRGPGAQAGGCDCGEVHHHQAMPLMQSPMTPMPVPNTTPEAIEVVPSPTVAPTPATSATPTSMKRLNPARNRTQARTVSTR